MAGMKAICGGILLDDNDFKIEEQVIKLKNAGDSGGTNDYASATNKPKINNVELRSGNNTLDELGIQSKGEYLTTSQADGKYQTKGNYLTSESNIAATKVTEDTNHEFVTNAEKIKWNGLQNYVLPKANTTTLGGVKQCKAVLEASGSNVTNVEFKALLDALKEAGIMANS